MKFVILSVFLVAIAPTFGAKGNKQSSSPIVTGAPSNSVGGYSQPIPSSYAAPPMPPHIPRTDMYSYSQPMGAGSNQAEYYQPIDSGSAVGGYNSYGGQGSAGGYQSRHQQPYYEPVPQGSGHHHPIKRGHGHGWASHGGESTLFLIIPLLIIPLLLCWPYFLYAASHHHHPVVYAGGWKRSSDGKAPTVKEAKDKKTDELTEKILPKLN